MAGLLAHTSGAVLADVGGPEGAEVPVVGPVAALVGVVVLAVGAVAVVVVPDCWAPTWQSIAAAGMVGLEGQGGTSQGIVPPFHAEISMFRGLPKL
jgi:hypothetical protein